ncbi:uncharacterized protein [Mytilus edulis]|uniref:uncharacterized protein n=1 Tax=Mytilus edulis TaxID=6550 RepID=UPI0039F0AFFB
MSRYMKAEKKQFSKNVHDFIIRPLLRQRQTGELCDITLVINGKKFSAHRSILGLWSPYFLSMFTCDMREKSLEEIDLSESLVLDDDDVFGLVLDYMYTGSLTICIENVEAVLRISNFLLLDDVKEYCRQFYIDLGNLDLSNCLRVRFLAETHNLLDVCNACQKMIESRFHDYLIFQPDIIALPPQYFFQLLEDPRNVIHSNYSDLKKLIQKWVDFDRATRIDFHEDLSACIKLWVCDSTDTPSTMLSFGCMDFYKSEISMQSSLTDGNRKAKGYVLLSQVRDNVMHGSFGMQEDPKPVLYSVVCNQGMKYIKMLVYSIFDRKWYSFPIPGEKLSHLIPTRQTVCSLVSYRSCLYMYLCSSFPYPTDMLKINILMIDMLKGAPVLYSFRTTDFYNPSYRTTLTNYRSVPPAIVACNHHLYIVGNREGTGNIFMCNTTNQQYKCFQIPGARFISLARAVVKNDRFIFLWFRHRTGPSEEFSIKKNIGFVMFDSKNRIFNSWEISPPEISYDDFSSPYTLCVRDETVLIYHPGKPALVLDEVRYKWIISLRKVPSLEITKYADAYGFHLHVATNNGIFVLENDAPFTTSMYEINETFPHPIVHVPPPIDNLSLVAAGYLSSQDLNGLEVFDKYDECYANALHVTMKLSEPETEDSGTSPSDRDSENDFEYDEDIYDYDYDLTGEYGF